jgi:hypothetical protein
MGNARSVVQPALRGSARLSASRGDRSPRAIGDIGDLRPLSAKSEHVQRFDPASGKPLFVCGAGAC